MKSLLWGGWWGGEWWCVEGWCGVISIPTTELHQPEVGLGWAVTKKERKNAYIFFGTPFNPNLTQLQVGVTQLLVSKLK